MQKFNIKDIVTMKDVNQILYMVVDYADFTELAPNGKPIIDIDYELIQIYPVKKMPQYTIVGQNEIVLKESEGSKNHKLLLTFIQKDREKRGWFGVPDFITISDNNLKSIQKGKVNEVQNSSKKLDTIRYDILNSVDKCLDALNDLDILHKMFGDEAYLQLKEVVIKRLTILSK